MIDSTRGRLAPILSALIIALAAATAAQARAPAAASPTIGATTPVVQAEVIGVRNNRGDVVCSLFSNPKAFPRDGKDALRTVKAPIVGGHADCNFTGVPPGNYAIVVFHDENRDGEFNRNAFGMPEEGYGFSRDAAALFSPPTFDKAEFHYDGTRLYMIINLRY